MILPCSQVITRDGFLSAACDGRAGNPEDNEQAPERGPASGSYAWKEALRQGIRFHGADALLPRLYGHAAPVFSYLPADALVVVVDSVECAAAARNAFEEAEERYSLVGEEEGYPAPAELVVPEAELVGRALPRPDARLRRDRGSPLRAEGPAARGTRGWTGTRRSGEAPPPPPRKGSSTRWPTEAKAWWKRGDRFIVSSLSPSQVDRMEDFLSRYAVPLSRVDSLREALSRNRGVFLCGSEVTRGFRAPELRAAIVTESEIFGEKARARHPRRSGSPSPRSSRSRTCA